MRIITGIRRGVRLSSLPGDLTRPTSERVKEAVFSAIQFELAGRRVLDLFAGSGQMGLEALSRGADSAVFVDASPDAMAVIKENAKKASFFELSKFKLSDYRTYINKASDAFDLVFIDPPYGTEAETDALLRLTKKGLLKSGAICVLESGRPLFSDGVPAGFTLKKSARYSISYITILLYTGDAAV